MQPKTFGHTTLPKTYSLVLLLLGKKSHPSPSFSSISKVLFLLPNPLWHNKGRLASTLCHCEWFVSLLFYFQVLSHNCLHLG
jgi:hypothetical protein